MMHLNKYLGLFALLFSFNAHSQIIETTIAPESNLDYTGRKILLITENDTYVHIGTVGHRPTPVDQPTNCYNGYEDMHNHIYKISSEGQILGSHEIHKELIFQDVIHLGGSHYAQIGALPCEKTFTDEHGIGQYYKGQTLIAGIADTIGASDSNLNLIVGLQDPDCDFDLGRYDGTATKDGMVYCLYKRANGYDKCKYLWKFDPITESTEKIAIQGNPMRVQRTQDQTGFFALFEDGNDPYVWRLGELEVDGSSTMISSSISSETEEGIPLFLYKNDMLFTAATNYYKSTDVRRYDMDGNILGQYTTGYRTKKMYLTSVGLLVIQEPIQLPHGDEEKPLKMQLFDLSVNQIDYREFGFEKLRTHDFDFDPSTETLTIIGSIAHTGTPDMTEVNEKAYFFRAKISDIFPNATAIESLESGRIYPNPSNDSAVFLELKNSDELESDAELVLRFFDVQGKSVNPSYSKAGPALYEINSSELPTGTYLGVVETADGERVFSQLFVVDR